MLLVELFYSSALFFGRGRDKVTGRKGSSGKGGDGIISK